MTDTDLAGPVEPPTRGRPRSAEVDQAIVQATLELLVSEGLARMSVEKVRQRAGVGKAAIYRRYPSKTELVKGAITYLNQELPVPDDTGSIRGDLDAVAQYALQAARATGAGDVMPLLMAEAARDPDVRDLFREALVERRRAVIRAILERAAARGELREGLDLDQAIDLITGPMIYRILIGGLGSPEELPEAFMGYVDAILRGIGTDKA